MTFPRKRLGRSVSCVSDLPGSPVVGESLADPSTDPLVCIVVAGLEGLDHGRDPGSGRAVRECMDHLAADQGIGVIDQ
jgi:hypothetical protein